MERRLRGEPLDRPSPQELRILKLIAKGQTRAQIAAALGTSTWTVHSQMKSVFYRLGTTNRTRAVVLAMQKGYIA